MCTQQRRFLINPPPCFPSLLYLAPFIWSNPSFYLLGDPASFARDANPLLSLVCYQLFSPCCFPHPRHPTDQVTDLHRWHQQLQPSRLTQLVCRKYSWNSEQTVLHDFWPSVFMRRHCLGPCSISYSCLDFSEISNVEFRSAQWTIQQNHQFGILRIISASLG
jgi:hypothetical protein